MTDESVPVKKYSPMQVAESESKMQPWLSKETDCAAALGSSTSSAVAARPVALVAVTCAALVLYWAALPVAR